MCRVTYKIIFLLAAFFCAVPAIAQEKAQGPPPARVVTAKSVSGMTAPQVEIIGTVYFPEVSDVASEVSGRVVAVDFEEGGRVKKGQILVRIDTELLEKGLLATRASFEQAEASLERSRIDLSRISKLFESESVSEREYDDARYGVRELEKKAESLKAEVDRLALQIIKAKVPAPFGGVVLTKYVQRGEWLSPGAKAATVARDDFVDVVVDVPGDVFPFVKPGQEAEVRAGGRTLTAKVFAVIPKGDVATRTFPVKVRAANTMGLVQGMEARVRLPAGEKIKAVIVPRDAVIQSQGRTVVFVVKEGAASLIPVTVAAYMGMEAAVHGPGLTEGMDIVIKGNERLRPGQAVNAASK